MDFRKAKAIGYEIYREIVVFWCYHINKKKQWCFWAGRGYVVSAQKQVTAAVNSAMVIAYWNIGKQIYDACGENERAEYGKQLLKYLAEKLTKEFGKGFSERNLQLMR